jgi:hypothetical protein
MDELKGKTRDLQQRLAQGSLTIFAGIDQVFRKIDQRAIAGLVFLLLALVLVSRPDTGAIAWLYVHGLSPRGYGYAMVVVGGIILRWPRTRLYGLLILIFLPYLFGTFGYVLEGNINAAPGILYTALFYYMLRAE